MNASPASPAVKRQLLGAAIVLALGAAVSLGLARFSYVLLLPPMRSDLAWSYLTAGAMNAANAAGYLLGALAMPRVLTRLGARRSLLLGCLAASVLMGAHALTRSDALLYLLRTAAGVASAAGFVAGGLLAARLTLQAQPGTGISPGLVLGMYYGGVGQGIVASALVLPPLLTLSPGGPHALASWQWGWAALALMALLATLAMRAVVEQPAPAAATNAGPRTPPAVWRLFAWGLAGYLMFGLGYIGYMTFIVTLLREQGMGSVTVAAFYTLLGVGVMVSPWLWARLLQSHRDGRPLMVLTGLLAVATAMPVLPGVGRHALVVFASGALFGAVFASVVAATTALVRHNLAPADWPAGISAFTVVFAVGQIIGPAMVGWLSDGPGGLHLGLAASAAALLLGALLASRQAALGSRP